MSNDDKTDLTPKDLAKMHERATYWNPPARDQCIGEDHMARDVLELLDEVARLRAGLRDAFDAGARAAVAEIHGGDDLPANMDITKLPGRPK